MINMAENKPIELKLKDKKILAELDFDARKTNSKIAKIVGLNKQNVDYRINKMIEKGIITHYYPLVNLNCLGLTYCRAFIRFNNMTENTEKTILTELLNNSKINWAVKFEGNYDILIGMWVKTISEFKNAIDDFVSKHGLYIKDKTESICTKLVHYPNRYILNTAEFREITFSEDDKLQKIDEFDQKIIESLSKDARKPLVRIANELNTSSKVIAYRIKNMNKKGILCGSRANIENNILGFTHYKVLLYLNNISENNIKMLKGYLAKNSKVIYFVEEVGPWNFDVECMFKSNQEYFEFIKNLRYKFPELIREYETLIVVKTIKVGYF